MAGSFTVISLSSEQKVNVGNFIQAFFNSQESLSVDRGAIFKESLWQHFMSTFLIWIFGLFVWGLPFILVIMGIKGFFFGFTIGFMIQHYRFGGFLFSLICILPQSIIYVPCYIGMVIISLLFSLSNYGKNKGHYTRQQHNNRLGLYTRKMITGFTILLIGSLMETFIAPLLFPLFLWIFR